MVITESHVRAKVKEGIKKLKIEPRDILTPSAKQYLSEKCIELIKESNNKIEIKKSMNEDKEVMTTESSPKFRGLRNEFYIEKGEGLTHLWGNILVPKSNKRIVFRGELDILLSDWILLQKKSNERKNNKLSEDLQSIFLFIKNLIKAEITDSHLEKIDLLGMSYEKIRETSHNPKKFYGVDHLFGIDATYNEIILLLNRVRASVRKLELISLESYYTENGLKKEEVNEALNRLSSAIYIMMLKGKSGVYGAERVR